MAKCAACGKFLSPTGAATCTSCPCLFHKACVAIPDNQNVKKDWVCPECKKLQRKGDNSSTPVKGILSDISAQPHVHQSTDVDSPTTEAAPVVNSDVRELRHELIKYMAEQRDFRNEFRASISNLGERMNGFEKRLEALENREATPGSASCSEDFQVLQQTVVQLRAELHDRDQDSLLADLEIGHLPEEKGENVVHSVTILAAKLGVALDDRDIVFAERIGAVGSSGMTDGAAHASDGGSGGGSCPGGTGVRPRRVVVRLSRRHLRDELLRAARVRRNLVTADIGLSGPPRRVYINERLTRNNRQLFQRVREECRKRQWRYSWTKRGRVYARQADGKPVHPIRIEADFERVFGSEAV